MSETKMDWQSKKLKEITTKIGSGATPRGGKNSYLSKGISLIRSLNVYDYEFIDDDLAFISQDQADVLDNVVVQENDILLNITGASVARCCMVENRYLPARVNQHVSIIRVNPEKADARFVLYCINSPLFKKQLLTLAQGGATREALTKTTIEEFEVLQPPLKTQQKVAGILSSYDELIKNNQRRIKILEEMARSLYREWFVHFRYPGHEKDRRVKSPMGDTSASLGAGIPEGWEIGTLSDLVKFKSGFAFKSGTFTTNGEHRLVTIKNVQDGMFNPESDSRMDELPEYFPDYCFLNNGDILLSLTGNVGRVCLVYDSPFLLNQRVSKLEPVQESDWALIYCMFREQEMRTKLEQLSNGVAQQNLSPVLASKMDYVIPAIEVRNQFTTLAEPMVKQIVHLYSTIKNLRQTRDLLLPRLMAGSIKLKNIL